MELSSEITLKALLITTVLINVNNGETGPHRQHDVQLRIKHSIKGPDENLTGYIDYYPGTMPLILTAPHGGYLAPESIPDRTAGCWQGSACVFNHHCGTPDETRCKSTVEPDDEVIDLSLRMRTAIYDLTGEYPHVVLNLLKRTKLDPNRDKDEAAFGVPVAMKAWDEYYAYIHQSKSKFQGRAGLLIDVHGQSHTIVRTEMGYLLSGEDLDNNHLIPAKSSVKALAERVNISFSELIQGKNSLGGLLETEGFDAIPSPKYPAPNGNPYFTGYYTIESEGSRDHGNVDAIMAESAHPYRTDAERPKYAKSFSKAIAIYMEKYYGLKLKASNSSDNKTHKNSSKVNTSAILFGVVAVCVVLVMLLILVSRLKNKPKFQPRPKYEEI